MMSKDPFSEEKRSEIMRSVGNVDTEPEMLLRRELWHRGFRYHVNERVEGIRPDLVFQGPHVAVYVDGCFWHGCPRHYSAPESNADFWKQKLERNQARDRRNNQTLEEAGWTVLRFWECEIREDVEEVGDEVVDSLR